MPAAPAITAGASVLGSVIGGKGQASAQQTASNTAQQQGQEQANLVQQGLNQQAGATRLYDQNTATPAHQYAAQLEQGASANRYLEPENKAAGAVSSYNPNQGLSSYESQLSHWDPSNASIGQLQNFGQSAGNQAVANFGNSSANQALSNFGTSSANQALSNYQGLTPQELNALTANASASGLSDINTLMSRGGGGANQNALDQNLLQQNRQATDTAAVNIGAQASAQELGAREAAAQNTLSGLSGAASNTLQGLSTADQAALSGLSTAGSEQNVANAQALQGLTTAGSMQQQANTTTAQDRQNATSDYGNIAGQGLESLYQMLGLAGGSPNNSSGLQFLNSAAGQYGNAATQSTAAAQAGGNPYQNMLSGLSGALNQYQNSGAAGGGKTGGTSTGAGYNTGADNIYGGTGAGGSTLAAQYTP